ncbi:MAG: serine/threonine-protein phosphatase [Ignavibacteria bacterium]|nr:serine/threonine-protein phosphatase [Ignavibacteria bacterium]MBT8383033.1 serine/threonine-protein phosphatase [Ignavibacteria bacterium]MBT8391857.1 serine/threonine-protein phosphatase [Ignavibacteria bacterium]NNJ53975.1 serine/threonine-protein phosphatase [Ignavibacteriaceae bacterium]NNL21490.1 serine/threonine-protein phosphatase [Ignavibacteriaceae bacterium]
MDQRKLHKLVETIASGKFKSAEDMLINTVEGIIANENIDVTGGRIWKLDESKKSYKLLYQIGNIEKIDSSFRIDITRYKVLDLVAKQRTILGKETITALREKGIFKYSASGVGSRIKIDEKYYYEYLLALNSENLNESFLLNLNIIATALTSKIKQIRSSASVSHLRADIDKARHLQKSILPEHEYNFHDYELYGITQPAEIVGGDFFDYLEHSDEGERLGVAIGDAASKGVGAAAEAMYISGALRMASSFEIKIASLMKRMNELVNKIFEDDKFTSLFYGELTTHTGGLFLYSNAGHNPPIFLKSDTGEIELLNPTGPVLGPAPNAKYYLESVNFSKGDILLLFSDGITEAANKKFEQYGEERLIKKLKDLKNLSSKEIALAILDDVIRFSKNGKYTDDITIVTIKKIK